MHYRTLGNTNLSVSEIGLGCESRCPFGVAVTQNMAEAAERFGY